MEKRKRRDESKTMRLQMGQEVICERKKRGQRSKTRRMQSLRFHDFDANAINDDNEIQ